MTTVSLGAAVDSAVAWGPAGSTLASNTNGAIELGLAGGASNTPFIDLHFNGASRAEDYNVRIINSANGVLDFTNASGTLRFNTTALTSPFPVGGPVGAVGAPSFVSSADLDTGVWFPSANVWAASAGGVEFIRSTTTLTTLALNAAVTGTFAVTSTSTFTGALTWGPAGSSLSANASGAIELGATGGLNNTPFIDFHFNGAARAEDYNFRVINAAASQLDFTAQTGGTPLSLQGAQVVSLAGAVGAPAYSTTGDLDCGRWFPTTNTIADSAGGTEVWRSTSALTTFALATNVTGLLSANGGLDRSTAAALAIGPTNATSVVITPNVTHSGTTTMTGAAFANGGLDRSTAASLLIGAANATSVVITPATTVSGLLTTSALIRNTDGTAASPGYSFTSDTNTGIWRGTTDTLDFATNGITQFEINTTLITAVLPVGAAAGLVGSPSFTASADLDTGMWFPASNTLAFSAGATEFLRSTTTTTTLALNVAVTGTTTSTGVVIGPAGAVGACAFTSVGDLNNGWWFPGADIQAWSTAGVERMRITAGGLVNFGAATPTYQTQITGAGQATDTAVADGGNKGAALYLLDTAGSGQNGGVLFFGANSSATPFACFKGSLQDAGTNTRGDIVLLNRNANADTTLTERMRWHFGGGVTIGAPTGSTKGAGTLNATAVYDDGTLLTCYVPEYVATGKIDLARWDASIPSREHPRPETADVLEASAATDTVVGSRLVHGPARRFAANAEDELDPETYAKKWVDAGHLPAMPSPSEWIDAGNKMPVGRIIQGLWETAEVLATHVMKLQQRLAVLEAANG